MGFVEKNLAAARSRRLRGTPRSELWLARWERCLAAVRNQSIAYDPSRVHRLSRPAPLALLTSVPPAAVRANPERAGPNTACYALAAASGVGREDSSAWPSHSPWSGPADGIWGEASEEAHDATVEAVQAVGAEVDGVYGAGDQERPARQGRTAGGSNGSATLTGTIPEERMVGLLSESFLTKGATVEGAANFDARKHMVRQTKLALSTPRCWLLLE